MTAPGLFPPPPPPAPRPAVGNIEGGTERVEVDANVCAQSLHKPSQALYTPATAKTKKNAQLAGLFPRRDTPSPKTHTIPPDRIHAYVHIDAHFFCPPWTATQQPVRPLVCTGTSANAQRRPGTYRMEAMSS